MGLVIVGSSSSNGMEVDADNHAKINIRPPAYGSLGYYRMVARSGAITATLGANSDLFAAQWTSSSDFAIIHSISVSAYVVSTITSAVTFNLAAFVARSFSVADSSGTAVTLTGNNQKLRTSMGTSLFGDMRIASTAGLSAGTRTLDANPIGTVQGFAASGSGNVGSQFFTGPPTPAPLYVRDNDDQHPVVLAQNEGIIIQNPLAGPATGTFTIVVTMEWGEVAAY